MNVQDIIKYYVYRCTLLTVDWGGVSKGNCRVIKFGIDYGGGRGEGHRVKGNEIDHRLRWR